jgi:hypothetical protein
MVKHPWYGMNCSDVKETYTLMDFTSAGVASDTLYVTGCHPRLSRSLEDDRSHALCVTDLRVSSSSRPLCCNQKWSCASGREQIQGMLQLLSTYCKQCLNIVLIWYAVVCLPCLGRLGKMRTQNT